MDIARLRYMADQIARNFTAMSQEDAVAAVADHIVMFWDPRMKAAIMADDPSQLSPVAAAAIAHLKAGVEPEHQTRATEFNTVDEIGHSDAG